MVIGSQGYRREPILLVITQPGAVLSDTEDDGFSWLVGSLGRATGEWATSVEAGQPWDRPPMPFHVVLQAERAEIEHAVARPQAWCSDGLSHGEGRRARSLLYVGFSARGFKNALRRVVFTVPQAPQVW